MYNALYKHLTSCLKSSRLNFQGIPLHLQIDTYEDPDSSDAEPVHRAFCQIKVFRDKVPF